MFEKLLHVYTVEGMKCEKCSARIIDTVKKIKGIKNVEVDLENKLVIVVSNKKVTPESVREIINNLGFEVVSFE